MTLNRRHLLGASLAALLPAVARAGEPVRIPFRYYRDLVPVIDVTLNGQGPYPFAFATGSVVFTMNWDLAHDLRLPHVNQVRNFLFNNTTISPGSKDPETDFEVTSVKVGSRDLGSRVFDSSRPEPADKAWHDRHVHDVDFSRGLLGTAFFLETPCVIDYAAREIRFHDDGVPGLDAFSALNTRTPAMGPAHDRSIEVDATLQGASLNCWIDTSGLAELYLMSHYVRRHDLYDAFADYADRPLDRLDPSKGTVRVVRMQDFVLGDIHFGEINVTMADPNISDRLEDGGVDAVIARGLLSQMDVAFQDKTVYVRPNAAFKPVSGPYVPPPPLD